VDTCAYSQAADKLIRVEFIGQMNSWGLAALSFLKSLFHSKTRHPSKAPAINAAEGAEEQH
jgi:hypothetical protein